MTEKTSDKDIEEFGEKIAELLDQAISDDSVTFENPNLLTCWQEKNCKKEDCSLYNQKKELRCWQKSGTYCGGEIQGVFAEKYKNCRQ